MCLTWIAIIASSLMGIGSAVAFIFAVKKDYYHNINNRERQSANPEGFHSRAIQMKVR
ncbi:MAG TPA: hypothetical protein VJ810_28070 [Blastocatellia bacterium]|nr:hypothetical protein [Blastocatellia bacterium]